MKHLDRTVFECIAAAVSTRAREMNVRGVMIVVDIKCSTAMFALINTGTALRIGVPDKDNLNFMAVAFAKAATVWVHHRNTGRDNGIKWEPPWRGGRISKDGRFIYAFSGADQDDDNRLTIVAERAHKSWRCSRKDRSHKRPALKPARKSGGCSGS